MPEQITGFEYEVRASMKAIREGKLECMEMPHEESIRIMEQMDGLRKDWGLNIHLKKETDRASNYVLVIIISCPWQKVVLGQQYFE